MEKQLKPNRMSSRKRQASKCLEPKLRENNPILTNQIQQNEGNRPIFASVHRPRHNAVKREQQQVLHHQQQILNPSQLPNSVILNQHQHYQKEQTEIHRHGQHIHQLQLQHKPMANGTSSFNFVYVTSSSNHETTTKNSNCGLGTSSKNEIPSNRLENYFPGYQSTSVSATSNNTKNTDGKNAINTFHEANDAFKAEQHQFFQGRLPVNMRQQFIYKEKAEVIRPPVDANFPSSSKILVQNSHPQHNHPSYNQISKTATNLLHDIYEKYLLNQTTFENVALMQKSTPCQIHLQKNPTFISEPSHESYRNSLVLNETPNNLYFRQNQNIRSPGNGQSNDDYYHHSLTNQPPQLPQQQRLDDVQASTLQGQSQQHNVSYQHQLQLQLPPQNDKPLNTLFKPSLTQPILHFCKSNYQYDQKVKNNQSEQEKFVVNQNNHNRQNEYKAADTMNALKANEVECSSPVHLYESIPEPRHQSFRTQKKRLPGKVQRIKTDLNIKKQQNINASQKKQMSNNENCFNGTNSNFIHKPTILTIPPPPPLPPPPLQHQKIGNEHTQMITQNTKEMHSLAQQQNKKCQKDITTKPPSGKQILKQQQQQQQQQQKTFPIEITENSLSNNSSCIKGNGLLSYPVERISISDIATAGNNNPSVAKINTNKNNKSDTVNSIQNIRGIPSGSAAIINKENNFSYTNNSIDIKEQQKKLPPLPLKNCKINEDENCGLFLAIDENPGIAKFNYRNNKIDLMQETAQAMAAAAYYAKAAQKIASQNSKNRSTDMPNQTPSPTTSRNGGFCGALQRAPPPMPPGLARRLANKENYGIGKVKVMLRVSDVHADDDTSHFMTVDKKKRQVTLTDPTMTTANVTTTNSPATQDRGPMVAAPKMFAFDNLFTAEDQQYDVCSSALSEVIPAVLEGSDGCLLSIGYPNSGQSRTMLGAINSSQELGAIPCAISWLYKGINERRQKSGARFSVRVSALGINATKPDSSPKDLLAAHATESDDSPGVYLRDDFLGGPTELRAPTAERAALFLDAAMAGRPQQQLQHYNSALEPAMIFTLHVYQYSLSRKGGVAGGRSRLHLIDLGGCANRNGGLPLSGIGNILLAILSGQRHPPNKDHPLTPLLKDCLAPLTCHVSILAHVTHTQAHTDALTTIQLASRIHRMRRRKHRFPIPSDKAMGGNAGHQSGGSSEGPDPSSSDLSADTVIYMGPSDDATDGEHPPVYLPSLSSGDNRCAMSKVLKGSSVEKLSKIPAKKIIQKPQSPVTANRTNSLKRGNNNLISSSPTQPIQANVSENPIVGQVFSPVHGSPVKLVTPSSTTKIVAGTLRHSNISKGSNCSTPKGSPLRRQTSASTNESPVRQITEEQWIDGPRLSRAKVAEARHLLREINHVKQCETWVDGPKSAAVSPQHHTQMPQKSVSVVSQNVQCTTNSQIPGNLAQGYGFMDSHKKTMIRQWVENQSSHIFPSSPTHQQQSASPQTQIQQIQQQQIQQQLRNISYHLSQYSKQKSEDDQHSTGSHHEMINPLATGLSNISKQQNSNIALESSIRSGLKSNNDGIDMDSIRSENSANGINHQFNETSNTNREDEEDQDSGPSEVPPALPLITPLGSREISHESLHRIISRHTSRESLSAQHHPMNHPMMDCGLQVTEEEIARSMLNGEHPLAALSNGDISIVSSFNIGDAFSDCAMVERTRNQFDQLARLREIFTSQLAMAEVIPPFRLGHDAGSVYSEPAFRFNTGPGSVCSEPPYRPPSPRCGSCHQSLHASRSPSNTSLPSLNGIMTIAGMEQYASLRHPDGASDPNLPKNEFPQPAVVIKQNEYDNEDEIIDEKSGLLSKHSSLEEKSLLCDLPIVPQTQLPLLPLNTSSEAYDSGHDSSTPRTSKHSGISRRAESGYHSVATARDSDESSFTSASITKEPLRHQSENSAQRITLKKKRQDKTLCNWLRNPFTCTYPETEGEISDF